MVQLHPLFVSPENLNLEISLYPFLYLINTVTNSTTLAFFWQFSMYPVVVQQLELMHIYVSFYVAYEWLTDSSYWPAIDEVRQDNYCLFIQHYMLVVNNSELRNFSNFPIIFVRTARGHIHTVIIKLSTTKYQEICIFSW